MQASKIIPGQVYAIRRDDTLIRFRVREVVTRRTRGSGGPHDYQSAAIGSVEEGEEPREAITLKPEAVLGPYEDYVELVARKKEEDAERDRKKNAADEAFDQKVRELYSLTGLPMPDDFRKSYGNPITKRYNNEVELSAEGLDAVLNALRAARKVA